MRRSSTVADDKPAVRSLEEIAKAANALSPDQLAQIEAAAQAAAQQTIDSQQDDSLGRQLGLTTRAGLEGIAGTVGLVYNPIYAVQQKITGGEFKPLQQQVSEALTEIGVPEPEGTGERVVQAISQAMAGGGGQAAVAKRLESVLTGLPKEFAKVFAEKIGQQTIAAGAAGGSGQATAEMGGGPVAQIIASLIGGYAGGRTAGTKFDTMPDDLPETMRLAEEAGVRVMTTDVKPPSTFAGKYGQRLTESVPVVGTGGQRAAQQTERIEAIRDVLRTYGADDAPNAADQVMDSLLRVRSENLGKYTAMKTDVISDLQDAGPVDVSRAVTAIDREIENLRLLNLDTNAPIIKTLQDWRSALLGERRVQQPDGSFTVEARGQSLPQIEEIRKSVGKIFSDPSLAAIRDLGEKTLSRIYGPLNEDMGVFIQANGRPRDFTRWKTANTRLAEIAGELQNNTLKNALKKGDVSPEVIRGLLFSSKPSDIRTLFRNLDETGKRNARTAILYEALQKAGGDVPSAPTVLEGAVSPERFKTQLQKLAKSTGVAFSGDDLKAIEGLERVLDLTQRAGQANVSPMTGALLQIPIVSGLLTQTFGGVGGGLVAAVGIGGVGRIFESAPVRNVLMKIPQTKSGSPEEAELIKRAIDAMRTQANIEQENVVMAQDVAPTEAAPTEEEAESQSLRSILDALNEDAAQKVLNATR